MSTFYSKINEDLKNIWRYAAFYPPIKNENQLTLGEGNTPEISDSGAGAPGGAGSAVGGQIANLAKKLGFEKLIFKREDINPNGSHKDRALCYQISWAKENGDKALIVSSSGNAAVSAAAYCQLAGIRLFVFISPKTDKERLARVANFGACVIISKHAITLADLAAKKFGVKNLKPSASENSRHGLKSIAFEIFEHSGEVDSVFIPTSSASTLLGVSDGFNDLINLGSIRRVPQIYAVQTAKVHPIAEHFDRNFAVESESLARGIISKSIEGEKMSRILKVIKKSNGGGAIVSNHQIIESQNLLAEIGIFTGYESAAGFAGTIKLKDKLRGKKVVVLLTGRKSKAAEGISNTRKENIFEANNIDQIEVLFNEKLKNQNEK